MISPLAPSFTSHLLSWYDENRRDLPWRDDRSTYHIWLSEVMLQQTQVATVIPYYLRWLERFPKIADVASASIDDVLKMWEGLGYYRRARLFHQACQKIVAKHGGELPTNPTALRALPGIGAYTYAAVRSIAFGEALPAIDGNLKRIAARLGLLSSSAAALTTEATALLTPVISTDRPGDFNQALMDLGATLCTARSPQCESCPVSSHCRAYNSDAVERYPTKIARKSRPHQEVVIGIIRKGDFILIDRRPEEGLLGGLWEFPGGKIEAGEATVAALKREIMEEVGLEVTVDSLIGKIDHAYTHFTISMSAYSCDWSGGEPQNLGCTDTRWITWNEIEKYAFPGANRKLFPLIESTLLAASIPV